MRRGHSRLWRFAAVAIAAAVILAACANAVEEDLLPDLAISVSQGDRTVREGDLLLAEIVGGGKPVVVNFWAALCAPCRLEMPEFQRIYERRADEVSIVGVDIGPQWLLGTREQGEELLAELGITYPAGTTFDPEVNTKFNILGMPTTVFIDGEGRLLRTWTGLLTEAKINDFIDEMLEG